MIKKAPTLETSRLLLRHFTKDDYAESVKMWSDPKVYQFIGGVAFTPQQTWARLLSWIGHWSEMGFGFWAVVERDSSTFVGQIGMADHKRGIDLIEGTAEVGWILSPSCHGKGYATEGVKAAMDWADHVARFKTTTCIISPKNLPSISVAKKLDFKQIGEVVYLNEPTLVFERQSLGRI